METPLEKAWREMHEARVRCHQRIERSQRVSRWMIAALIVAVLAAVVPWELLLR